MLDTSDTSLRKKTMVEKCLIHPLGKFGDHWKGLGGCTWCQVREECLKIPAPVIKIKRVAREPVKEPVVRVKRAARTINLPIANPEKKTLKGLFEI